MAGPLVNRVAKSGIITINLESYYPSENIVSFDLKDYLFMEMILKEKDFRTALKELDWSAYQGAIVLIHCSTDAIIPVWAYMLVTTYLESFATTVYVGDKASFLTHHYQNVIKDMDVSSYSDKRIVIKGCSDQPVPPGAYQALTRKLKPHVVSIMYGEPCSTVPIYKRPKKG
ncbi:MAG: DUF2480 family protein [Saprospiraceae bacterium]|nr:DUF2480 family protein [Saprospiraceae bacterium]